MSKEQAKAFALSILAVARALFGSSKKGAFVVDILTNIVVENWDEGWDTYKSKQKVGDGE